MAKKRTRGNPQPLYRYLTRDLDTHRAEVTKTSGYALWTSEPELDGWWVGKEHSKCVKAVDLTAAEAETILAGKELAPGTLVKVMVPRVDFAAREEDASVEPRVSGADARKDWMVAHPAMA